MYDNQLFQLVIANINTGLIAAGLPTLPIKQAFQPTQQGVNTIPTAYIYKVGDKRYGWVERLDIWDSVNEIFNHQEVEQYETTFQISVLATQDPNNISGLTASDYLNNIISVLQNSAFIGILEEQGVGILRIMNVRNPYFMDDRGRYEASPSLDFILTHKQIINSTTPVSQSTELQILTV